MTQLLSAWVKRKNLASLQSLGGMSAEIQESLSNFRVIVAFNRLDYFRQKFNAANEQTYTASVSARDWPTTCSCRSTGWPTTWRSWWCSAYGIYSDRERAR